MSLSGRLRVLCVVLILLLSSTLCSVTVHGSPIRRLTVCFFDVGQGDAILIDFGRLEVLIDGGVRGSGIVGYLPRYVDGALDVIVATHPDPDHVGGLTEVLEEFDVRQVWWNGETEPNQRYADLVSGVQAEGAEVHAAHGGDTVKVGDLVLNVLNPVHITGDVNNDSIVLELTYGQVHFLFEGDAQGEAEANMLEEGLINKVQVLKVGHHGGDNASSLAFLAVAQPEVAVIQADDFNPGLRAEVIDRLKAVGSALYVTADQGSVWVSTDGQSCSMRTAV